MANNTDAIKHEERLDLQALEYFVKIGEVKSLSKASTILNVSQPTLTRHVQYLEEHFGARLFDRTGRGVILTEAGDRLLQDGKEILLRANQARAEISNIGDPASNSVILGLAPIAGNILNVPVAKRVISELPGTHLRIVEFFTGYVKEWIADGRIDVGILYADGTDASVEGEALWDEQYILVSRRGSGLDKRCDIRFSDLRKLPLVLPSGHHGLRMKVDEIAARMGIPLNIVLEIDGLNAILDLVHQAIGCTILTPPALHGFERSADLVVTPIVDPEVWSTAVVVCTTQRPVTKATRRLVDFIREEAKSWVSRSAKTGIEYQNVSHAGSSDLQSGVPAGRVVSREKQASQ